MSAFVSTAKRDLRIDSLRGLLLVFMAIDHISSDLQVATNHIFGYVSSAEGFVFISGLVCGLVYARRRWTAGAEAVQEACWRRAAVIYAFHLALYLFVWNWTLGGHVLFGKAWWFGTEPASWRAIIPGILLMNQPPLLDILPMYFGFMLLLPVVLQLFDRGWRAPVLAVSFGAWSLSNAFLPQSPWHIGVLHTSALSITAWQFLFIAGAACGHAWAAKGRIVPPPRVWSVGGAMALCAACYVVRHAFVPPPVPRGTLDWLTNKNNLAPLRLANTAALFYLFYAVAVRFPRVVQWRPIAFLGRNALPVFSVHVAVAYALNSFPEYFADTTAQRCLGTALMVGTMYLTADVASRLVRRPVRSLVPQPA